MTEVLPARDHLAGSLRPADSPEGEEARRIGQGHQAEDRLGEAEVRLGAAHPGVDRPGHTAPGATSGHVAAGRMGAVAVVDRQAVVEDRREAVEGPLEEDRPAGVDRREPDAHGATSGLASAGRRGQRADIPIQDFPGDHHRALAWEKEKVQASRLHRLDRRLRREGSPGPLNWVSPRFWVRL